MYYLINYLVVKSNIFSRQKVLLTPSFQPPKGIMAITHRVVNTMDTLAISPTITFPVAKIKIGMATPRPMAMPRMAELTNTYVG